MRFLVQAANGVGAVGLDTAEGDGYPVGVADNVDAADGATSPPRLPTRRGRRSVSRPR